MTKEEKDLLFCDLSARLPYHVRCKIWLKDGLTEEGTLDLKHNYGDVLRDAFLCKKIIDIKPYLRSRSSMTDEEVKELKKEHEKDERLYTECIIKAKNGDNMMRGKVIPHFAADWCNANHINYRLPDNLFIEAPEGMYTIK